MEDEPIEVVARVARRLRGDRTQDAVAKRKGVFGLDRSRAIVAAVETGQRRLDHREAALFAAALGTQVRDLVAGSSWQRTDTRPCRRSDQSRGGRVLLVWPQPVPPVVMAAASNEAERRAAAKPGERERGTFRLWSRSLTDERDRPRRSPGWTDRGPPRGDTRTGRCPRLGDPRATRRTTDRTPRRTHCCVRGAARRGTSPHVSGVRSDGFREFVKRRRYPETTISGIDAEFVGPRDAGSA